MRILHTSDWHLGKTLEGYSRLEEQKEFIDQLIAIVEQENVDLILLSGDVYDTSNPPADAERLFYKSITRLTDNGKRPIVVIAGNHDSPKRLGAVSPLAMENGVIIMETLETVIETGNYNGYSINRSGEGFIEIEINNEKAVIISVGFPSEMRLNRFIYSTLNEETMQQNYSDKISLILDGLSKNYGSDTINLMMGHFYIRGGYREESERDISLGGSFAVDSEAIPANTHYAAMGHLHRPQRVANAPIKHAYYSGSPVHYNKSEINHEKCVLIYDGIPGEEGIIRKAPLKTYKPIEIWKANGILQAIEQCVINQNRDCFVYLEIKTDRVLKQSEIKKMRNAKDNIIEIAPVFDTPLYIESYEEYEEKSIEEEFIEFYKSHRDVSPTGEMIDLFLKINSDPTNEIEGDDV